MKPQRKLNLFKDQENSKRGKPYLDKKNKIPVIQEEKVFSFKNKTNPKYIYSENNTYSNIRPKSTKKSLYSKPNIKPILTKQQINKEYLDCLSLEKINFQFDEYGNYPDDSFQPSIFFFKFLANKPDY